MDGNHLFVNELQFRINKRVHWFDFTNMSKCFKVTLRNYLAVFYLIKLQSFLGKRTA